MAMLDSLRSLNWHSPIVIGAVVLGGVAVAFFIVPKLRNISQSQQAAESGPAESASQQANVPGGTIIIEEQEPYTPTNAPSGTTPPPSTGNGSGTITESGGHTCPPGWHWNDITQRCEHEGPPPPVRGKLPPTGVKPPVRNPVDPTGGGVKPPVKNPKDPVKTKANQPAATPPKQFVHPTAWPQKQSTLSSIAQAHGISLSRIESFPENQYIKQRSGQGFNLIYPTDNIRIA